jgi:hypothetical protein
MLFENLKLSCRPPYHEGKRAVNAQVVSYVKRALERVHFYQSPRMAPHVRHIILDWSRIGPSERADPFKKLATYAMTTISAFPRVESVEVSGIDPVPWRFLQQLAAFPKPLDYFFAAILLGKPAVRRVASYTHSASCGEARKVPCDIFGTCIGGPA